MNGIRKYLLFLNKKTRQLIKKLTLHIFIKIVKSFYIMSKTIKRTLLLKFNSEKKT